MGSNTAYRLQFRRRDLAPAPHPATEESRTELGRLKEEVSGILAEFNQSPQDFVIEINTREIIITGPPLDVFLTTELILRLEGLAGNRQIHIEEQR